jgi:hypothetical protein
MRQYGSGLIDRGSGAGALACTPHIRGVDLPERLDRRIAPTGAGLAFEMEGIEGYRSAAICRHAQLHFLAEASAASGEYLPVHRASV